jgi:hypothetical protein
MRLTLARLADGEQAEGLGATREAQHAHELVVAEGTD